MILNNLDSILQVEFDIHKFIYLSGRSNVSSLIGQSCFCVVHPLPKQIWPTLRCLLKYVYNYLQDNKSAPNEGDIDRKGDNSGESPIDSNDLPNQES